jgi:hypothetical protein
MNELEKQCSQNEHSSAQTAPEVNDSTREGLDNENQILAESHAECDSVASVCEQKQEGEELSPVENEANNVEKNGDVEASTSDSGPMQTDEKEDLRKFYTMTKEELVAALHEILDNDRMSSHKEVAAIKQAYFSMRNKEIEAELAAFVDAGNSPDAFASTPDSTESELKELLNQFKERRAAFLAADEARRRENLELKTKILDSLHSLADDIDNINLHFQKFQQLQQEFKSIKDIPAGAENDIWKNYQAVTELFYDRLKMNKELRDLDFKKNLEIKKGLLQSAKELTEETDVIGAFRKLQDLHAQWRETGPVAKELRDEIWEEFRAASTVINKRHQEYFESRKAEEQANEEAKTKLCEEIEAIAFETFTSFVAWDQATKSIMDMQARWKKLGFASRKANNQLFARFRKRCDEFFSAKADYFKKAKEDFALNLEKKIALCERAEALKDSTDIRKATEEIVALQAEWKTIGTVARKHSDAVWQRFTEACNYFFNARKKQASDRRKEESANLSAKREIIAKLKAISVDQDRSEAIRQVRELQTEWQKVGHVPFKVKDKLYSEYREASNALYDSLDIREHKARMSNFEDQLNGMKDDDNKLSRERDRLFRTYESKRQELKTYENNLGFFNAKSSTGNSMLKEMERKMSKIREEMELISKKIEMLDSTISE